MDKSFILKGNICHTPVPGQLVIRENAFVVCEDGICRGVFDEVPERYAGLQVVDCGDRLILPGMTDLHLHAPQYAFCGTGMDDELLLWLERTAFPEEMRYADEAYAARAYGVFADRMKRGAATRAVIFATIHTKSSLILMDCMEKSGLVSYVGKVSMDRESPPELTEESAASAAAAEREFIRESLDRGYERTMPVITPRFVPSCSDALMEELGKIREEFDLPVQSHLSENPGEIDLVAELAPWSAFYGDVYDRFGLFGRQGRTVMAHCVHTGEKEAERIKECGVWIAHCPSSNMNLSSGIAPVRRYLDQGLRVGLGTDIGAGSSPSMFRAVTDAIQVSKLRWRLSGSGERPLTFAESFYLATKGGGSFFGKTGSFEEGCEFDALVLDDAVEPCARRLSVRERLERAVYLGLDERGIVMKFARGGLILEKKNR